MSTYKVTEKTNYCRHRAANVTDAYAPTESKETPLTWLFGSGNSEEKSKKDTYNASDNAGFWVYLYPNTGINCYDLVWYSMCVNPVGKNKTRLEYEVYAKKGAEESKVQEFITFLRQVEQEVFFSYND